MTTAPVAAVDFGILGAGGQAASTSDVVAVMNQVPYTHKTENP